MTKSIETKMVTHARNNLARRLSVDPDRITVREVRNVTWPDAALGCPQPGMMYAQIAQKGLLIRLGVGKEMFFYHSGATGEPFLCQQSAGMIPRPKDTEEFVPPPGWEID